MTIASLPMYYRDEVSEAHQQYWTAIRTGLLAGGVGCPVRLSHPEDLFSHWRSPGLVLSQTCGMPYRLWLHDKVTLVGTPDFGVEDSAPGWYRSALVVRADDDREQVSDYCNAIFAYNQAHSQSGFAAPYQHCKRAGFWFSQTVETGAHLNSVNAVASGLADIAAIDAVTWRLLLRHENGMDRLRVLDWTEATPGLPYITSVSCDHSIVFDAIDNAIALLSEKTKAALQLKGIVKIPEKAYLSVLNPDI